MPGLRQPAGGLDSAEALFDALAQPLAGGVARMAGGASVDAGLARLAQLAHSAVDRDVRSDTMVAQGVHEGGHVIGLVGAQRDAAARRWPRCTGMASAASGSALPEARVSAASKISALRFSTKRWPMQHSRVDWPSPLR